MYVTVLSRRHYGFTWLGHFPYPRLSGSCLSFGHLIFPSTSLQSLLHSRPSADVYWINESPTILSHSCSVNSEKLRFYVYNLKNLFLRYTKEDFYFLFSDLDGKPKLVLHIFRFTDVLSFGIKITSQKMVCHYHPLLSFDSVFNFQMSFKILF